MEQRLRNPGDENSREGLLTAILLAFMSLLLAKGLLGQSTTSDGLIYASIARNLAEHQGSFWQLQFSATVMNPFHEHPPLAMWLESGLFRVFGDPYWVERVFSTLCFVALVAIMGLLWRHSGFGRRFPAWPLLFLALMPHAYRTIYDHYLDVPLAAFAAMAVLAQLKCLAEPARARWLAWCLLAAAGLLGAFLVKGPVGLFPLVVMPLYALVRPAERQPWMGKFLVLTALCAAAAGFLWLDDESRAYLRVYFAKMVMSSLTGEREVYHARHALGLSGAHTVVQGRWFFLSVLAMNLAAGILLLGLPHLLGRRRANSAIRDGGNRRWMLFYLLLGLSASLPLGASPRQFSHYIYPSLPWFALAFAYAGEHRLQAAWQRLLARPFGRAVARSLLGLLLILVGIQAGRYLGDAGRHREYIALADQLHVQMGRSRVLSVCPALAGNVRLFGYLQRRSRISVDRYTAEPVAEWLLCTRVAGVEPGAGWARAPSGPDWTLWRRRAPTAE